jgi:copper/silver efflux system protein
MTVDRAAADRYGLNVADVEDVIETAIGGKNLTTTIEGRQRFPVRVRYARDFRENPQQLGEVLVAGSNGAQVPLSKGGHIKTTMGPSMISSENGLLRGAVLLNVRGRDVADLLIRLNGSGPEVRCRRATTLSGAASMKTRSARASAWSW